MYGSYSCLEASLRRGVTCSGYGPDLLDCVAEDRPLAEAQLEAVELGGLWLAVTVAPDPLSFRTA